MAEHRIDIDCPILTPEDGLLLGNGDLSVSIYQAVDEIRFRFGKGDVWDRRIDFSEDPKPAHINEVTEGILVEGWKCGPYGGPVEATKNAKNEKRMREICQGVPPSYEKRPFPCPKPVGELALHYSGDLQGLRIRQTLFIERSLVEIVCSWSNGVELWLNCFVASRDNTLLINWLLNGWSAESKYGGEFIGLPPVLPVWFSLYRWCDPRVGAFAADHIGSCRHPAFTIFPDEKIDPLPAPEIVALNGRHGIRQRFGSDAVFPAGFEYSITAQSDRAHIGPVARFDHAEARLHILPEQTSSSGTLAVAVATSSETTDTLSRAIESSDIDAADAHKWTLRDSSEFWSRSSIELADKQIEGLWYATLHAKRCVYRADRLPPGLFLPSTVHDYSFWHGDWHTNYNLQSMFLGDYACNHPELGDSYFRAMEYFLPIGRKIARDYYGCRGAFIQLSGFPTHPADDPLGCVPMGRMAYMTGWIANHYFERWRLTADRDWLGEEGYPAVREFALFYSDFLKKGNDELYHAFPSNQGEDGFSGSAADFTDRPQVMRHAGYCLHAAIEMSAAMNKDESLRAEWCAILKGLAVDESYARLSYDIAPEFLGFDGARSPDPARAPAFLSNPHDQSQWYPGKIPYEWSIHLHCGSFQTDRDWIGLKKLLQRWIRPNGLLWGMAKTNYGRGGGWTESLGIIRPITNLLLMTRGGIVDVFPYWPKNQDASFAGLRAYGGIMVSASLQSNRVRRIGLDLPPDSQCRLALPSARFDCSQNGMAFIPKVANGVASFCSARDNSSSITLEFVG